EADILEILLIPRRQEVGEELLDGSPPGQAIVGYHLPRRQEDDAADLSLNNFYAGPTVDLLGAKAARLHLDDVVAEASARPALLAFHEGVSFAAGERRLACQ